VGENAITNTASFIVNRLTEGTGSVTFSVLFKILALRIGGTLKLRGSGLLGRSGRCWRFSEFGHVFVDVCLLLTQGCSMLDIAVLFIELEIHGFRLGPISVIKTVVWARGHGLRLQQVPGRLMDVLTSKVRELCVVGIGILTRSIMGNGRSNRGSGCLVGVGLFGLYERGAVRYGALVSRAVHSRSISWTVVFMLVFPLHSLIGRCRRLLLLGRLVSGRGRIVAPPLGGGVTTGA